jgi:hypothetical protein
MSKCEYCGSEVMLPFECNFCGGHYCMEHRLPENHLCRNAPERSPLGSFESKKIIENVKKPKWNIMESEGDFHFKKKTPFSYRPQRKKSVPVGKIVAGVVVLGIIAVLILQGPAILSWIQASSPSNPFSGYQKLTLTLMQGQAVQFGNNYYSFSYIGPSSDYFDQGKLKFGMIAGLATTKIYDAIQGAKYNELGVALIVGEVHSDYMILYVKSTVPTS